MSASGCLACCEAPGVTLHCPAKVEAVSRSQESVSLTLEGGEIINGKLLVAADVPVQALAPAAASAGSSSRMSR